MTGLAQKLPFGLEFQNVSCLHIIFSSACTTHTSIGFENRRNLIPIFLFYLILSSLLIHRFSTFFLVFKYLPNTAG